MRPGSPRRRLHRLAAGTLLVLLTLLLTGCPTQTVRPVKDEPGDGIFSRAERLYRGGSYDRALSAYNDYLSRYPDGPYAPASLMKEATIYRSQGKNDTARSLYNHIIKEYPDSPVVSDAAYEILATFYREGDHKGLIRHADGMLKHASSRSYRYRIYRLLGDAYVGVGSPINAVYYYSRANQYADGESGNASARIRDAASRLDADDIDILLERIGDDPLTRGYLLYQLGLKRAEVEHGQEAAGHFEEVLRLFPDHEIAEEARRRIEELDILPLSKRHTIGCLLPLSGAYQLYGERALRGIELALSRFGRSPGGPTIRMVIGDTGSDPEKAVLAVTEMFESEPSAVIGPIITAESVASEAQRRRVPIITLTQKEGIPKIGDYVFRNFITPAMQVRAVVSHAARALGVYRYAVFYPDEKYGSTFMQLFWESVTAHGGTVVAVESYGTEMTDFSKPIRRLARAGDFEGLFIPDGPDKVGLILPQLAFHNMRNVQLLGTNLWHSDRLIKMARQFVQGAILPEGFFADSTAPEVTAFVRSFTETFGEAPGFIEAVAYDTARIVIGLMGEEGFRTRSGLRDALLRVRDFAGVTGRTTFRDDGEVEKDLYLLRVDGDGFVDATPETEVMPDELETPDGPITRLRRRR